MNHKLSFSPLSILYTIRYGCPLLLLQVGNLQYIMWTYNGSQEWWCLCIHRDKRDDKVLQKIQHNSPASHHQQHCWLEGWKFLGVHITDDLSWSLNSTSITKRARQHLQFLRANLPTLILTTFYKSTIEGLLSSCITVWDGNCTVLDCNTLQQRVRAGEKFIRKPPPPLKDI